MDDRTTWTHAGRAALLADTRPRAPQEWREDAAYCYGAPRQGTGEPLYQDQGSQYEASEGLALTDENLSRHEETCPSVSHRVLYCSQHVAANAPAQDDTHYAEDRAREDSTQLYYQEMYYWLHPDGRDANPLDEDDQRRFHEQQACSTTECFEVSMKMHDRPTASSATPAERYFTEGAAADSQPWFAKLYFPEVGIEYGEMRSAPKRHDVAREWVRYTTGAQSVGPSAYSVSVGPASIGRARSPHLTGGHEGIAMYDPSPELYWDTPRTMARGRQWEEGLAAEHSTVGERDSDSASAVARQRDVQDWVRYATGGQNVEASAYSMGVGPPSTPRAPTPSRSFGPERAGLWICSERSGCA